jgi:hypothetical protein
MNRWELNGGDGDEVGVGDGRKYSAWIRGRSWEPRGRVM